MKIDRDNYEIYFIDYLDGNLSLEEIDLLLDFMNENPHLKEELKGLEQIKIEESKEKIPAFNHLKRTELDHPDIFEETCTRAIEGDLTKEEKSLFEHYLLANKERQKDFKLFKATISEPDPFIVFEKKEQLKRKDRKLVPFYWYAAAAVILLGIFLFIPDKEQEVGIYPSQFAEDVSPTTPVVIEKDEPTPSFPLQKVQAKAIEKHKAASLPINELSSEPQRIPETIESMNPIVARVEPTVTEENEIALVPIVNPLSIKPKSYSKYLTPQEYFANRIEEVKKQSALEKFALNTLKRISGEKFDYSTRDDGKVEKLEFNSKLLAFTIPVGE